MILLKSVFNNQFDLQLPRGENIDISEFCFCFILLNIIYFQTFINKDKRNNRIGWFLATIFCLYAFWESDYFRYASSFYNKEFSDFKDYLYQFIQPLAFGSFIIFRLLVWGGALLIYYFTIKNFRIDPSLGIFVFSIFFLITFSYARASLGMSFYFLGLSILLNNKPTDNFKIISVIVCFILSFAAHRSLLLLITLTPILYFKLNKYIILIFLALLPFIINIFKYFLFPFFSENAVSIMGESSFSESVQGYSRLQGDTGINWKFGLVTVFRLYSFYISILYILYKIYRKYVKGLYPQIIIKLSTYTFFLVYISFSILMSAGSNMFGLRVIGYRYLYMSGIPITILLSYLYQYRYITNNELKLNLIFPLLYSELYILGKILVLAFFK